MFKEAIRDQNGFSLIEILVALFLVGIIVATLNYSGITGTPHEKLEDALFNIERAVRFAQDEAALRNVITRVQFSMGEPPHKMSVEYGPDDNFVLPKKLIQQSAVTSLAEAEERDKVKGELDKKFNKVSEFKDGDYEFPDGVSFVALGSDLYQKMITEDTASVYIYPTGERDSAIIVLGTDEEVASLSVEAFIGDFEWEFLRIDTGVGDLIEVQLEGAKELYDKWLK